MSRLIVRVCDEAGAAVPARLSVRSLSDREPMWPVSEHVRYDIVESWGEERSFVCDGEALLDVPPGEYELSAARGPESRAWHSTVAVESERTTVAEAVVSRWIDMTREGWFSGDVHVHRSPDELPLLLLAEDVNVGSSIAGYLDLDRHDEPQTMDYLGPAESGPAIRRIDESHLFSTTDLELERIMGGPGATIGLGLSTRPRLRADAWEPFDDVVCDMIRASGGHVDGEKVFWPSIPVLAALGKLDSVQIACNHFGQTWTHRDVAAAGGFGPEAGIDSPRAFVDWILELYYALLGCGFRVPVSGGSGAGVMPNPVGASRTYARLDGPLEHGSWLEAVKRGRTFSTNGPLIELDVAGSGPGETVSADDRRQLPVHIRVSAASSIAEVGLVVDGAMVEAWHPSGDPHATVEFETELDASRAGWIAVRAFEHQDHSEAIGFAHTSPVWLDAAAGPVSRARSGALVNSWLDWTERLMATAEQDAGRSLDAGREAVEQARRVVAARVAGQASSNR